MFTGIIEDKGKVVKVRPAKNLLTLTIEAPKIFQGSREGDSISVDGACLTISKLSRGAASFDVMKETIDKTTLKYLKSESIVNLEPALMVNRRVGGHFVLGHVDGVGIIKKKLVKENFVEYEIAVDKNLMRYIVSKGSVCVDGISLTVGKIRPNSFSVYIVPYTLKETTLKNKKLNDKVNIETDILAKYILDKVLLSKNILTETAV